MKISNYAATDAEEVSALLAAAPEVPSTPAEVFRSFAAQSFNREARDFKVVRADGRCVGLLTSTLIPGKAQALRHFRIVIHPSFRRRGIASELFAALKAQEAPPGTLWQSNSQESWASGNAFLEQLGFHITRTEWLMRRVSPMGPDTGSHGFLLRNATSADDAAWMALHRAAYRHLEDFSELTSSDLHAERLNPGFALVVAEHQDQVVGYCHSLELEEHQGLINSLVVSPEVKRRGLGSALLRSAIDSMAERNIDEVILNVLASNEPAIRLYENSGFQRYDDIRTYQRAAAG